MGSSQDGSLLVDSNNQTVTINKDSYSSDCYYYGMGNNHLVPIEPNTKYVCSFKKLDGEVSGVDESFIQSAFAVLDESLTVLQWAVNSGMRTDHANARYISKVRLHWSNKPANFTNFKFTMQLEKADTPTTHELHQSSLLTLPEEVVLRSLPNGICDTYNTRTGVYTQRVYETKFVPSLATSNNQWFNSATDWTNENARGVYVNFDNLTVPCPKRKRSENVVGQYILCDKLKQIPRSSSAGAFGGETKGIVYSSSYMGVMIPKSELREDSKEGVLEWLETNQCSIVYELETPIITKIDLPSLKAYNTVTHLSSTVGEGSLVPKLASDDTISYPVVIKPNTKYSIVAHKDRNNLG